MRFRHAVCSAVLAGLATAACGSAASPDATVRKAAEGLDGPGRAEYSLTLQGDQAKLTAWNETLSDEERATPEDMEAMLAVFHSGLHLVWDKGDDVKDLGDDALSLAVDVDGMKDAVEARFLDGNIYARALVRQLAERFHAPVDVLDDFAGQANELGIDFVDDALDGAWLSLELDPLLSFYKGINGSDLFEQGFEEEAGFSPSALKFEDFQKLVRAFSLFYERDVKVEKGTEEGPGQHYVLSATARDLYAGILPALKDLSIVKEFGFFDFAKVEDVPDDNYTLDVWVSDGRLTRVRFDFSQVVPKDSELKDMPTLAVQVDIDHDVAPVSAPKDVTNVDLFEIFGKIGAQMS